MTTLYDHPEYYDILFGWDRDAEAQSYDQALLDCGVERGSRVLEVAAGTAQIGVRLASMGWHVTALDVSEAMLEFAFRRYQRVGLRLDTLAADMSSFTSVEKFDGAVNPMSSFRILHDDAEVAAHLKCMADVIVPGGVYLIDSTFGTDGSPESDLDEWVMERDQIIVTATTRDIHVEDGPRHLSLRLEWPDALRPYTPVSFASAIDQNDFAIAGCYLDIGSGDDDVSRFSPTVAGDLPSAGRAIVVLSRV